MQSNPSTSDESDDIVLQTEIPLSEPPFSKTQKLDTSFGEKLKTVLVSVSSVPSGKLILGTVLLLGIFATFLTFAKGSTLCLWSDCSPVVPPTTGNEFWAFAGGASALIVLTTLMGLPLLPAVGIATGIWFLISKTIH